MVRSMMSHAELPLYLWGEAINIAQYILNRVPSKYMPNTPYELWTGAKPKMEHIKVWGCPVHVLLSPKERHGLQEKMRKNCSFVGYPSHAKGYRSYDHDNKIIMECQDVYFPENPTVSPRDRPRMVDFYEISKDKDVQASGGSDVVDVGNLTAG